MSHRGAFERTSSEEGRLPLDLYKPAQVGPFFAAMENELDQAKRRVTEGRRLIAAQEDLIKSLKTLGKPTRNAAITLETFLRLQAVYEDHLKALTSKRTGG